MLQIRTFLYHPREYEILQLVEARCPLIGPDANRSVTNWKYSVSFSIYQYRSVLPPKNIPPTLACVSRAYTHPLRPPIPTISHNNSETSPVCS